MKAIKVMAGVAALITCGLTTSAHAAPVIGLTLADTIDAAISGASGGTNSLGTDGRVGAFRFLAINRVTYSGAILFSGDAGGGVIDVNAANPVGAFSSGVPFAGTTIGLFTDGPINLETSAAADSAAVGSVLGVNDLLLGDLPWGGILMSDGFTLISTPDAGSFQVLDLIKVGAMQYAYRFGWTHVISDADDPSQIYTGQNLRWIIEGQLTTAAVPEPGSAALLGLGALAGLGVLRRRRTR